MAGGQPRHGRGASRGGGQTEDSSDNKAGQGRGMGRGKERRQKGGVVERQEYTYTEANTAKQIHNQSQCHLKHNRPGRLTDWQS